MKNQTTKALLSEFYKQKENKPLNQIIAITQLTMRRLLNYQRATENNANTANKRQWLEMTLETMRNAEKTRQLASHIRATVDYAGYLFRVQNKMTAYRPFYSDGHLHNALVKLMNTLAITIDMVGVDDCVDITINSAVPVQPVDKTPRKPFYLIAFNGSGESRCCR